MDRAIQISKVNDFIFCPYSIYLHSIYEDFADSLYHSDFQVRGRIKHKRIEAKKYSSLKKYLQGKSVFSSKYNLIGKIDLYDKEEETLIERKYKVNEIYDGYKYQLFAQKLCLEEEGYKVRRMIIHSLVDNKTYKIKLNKLEKLKFFATIEQMQKFDLNFNDSKVSEDKCNNCIYINLCEYAKS